MDFETILRRSPEVVIIDNLLHVNISASANEMRYHDVRDLLEQGISVITSTYSAFGKNLKTALDYVSGNFSIPFERWANLPADERIGRFQLCNIQVILISLPIEQTISKESEIRFDRSCPDLQT